MNKDRLWPVKAIFDGFITGDGTWGMTRLLSVAFVLLLFTAVGSYFDHAVLSLRFLVAGILAMMFGVLAGAKYVQDLYELKNVSLAVQYLVACMFGLGYPRLVINEGKKEIGKGQVNLLDVIGGPGYIVIRPGNVVLLERLKGPSNVRAAGFHFVSRGETIKEIVSLVDQKGCIEKTMATTKDGIEVVIRDVQFRYRLYSGHREGHTARTPVNPFPYSVQAVRNMAYHRNVRHDGLVPWSIAVRLVIDTVIGDYVAQHQVDHLTAPRQPDGDPRAEICKQLESKGVRERLKHLGAELLWFDIGHFDIPDKKVEEQRVNTWEAKWVGNANLVRAYGEAQHLAYQELGRAEAQAELLIGIVHALEDVGLSDDPTQNLRNVILMRTAQILDALGEAGEPTKSLPSEKPAQE